MKVSGCDLLARSLVGIGTRFVVGRDAGALGPVFAALEREEGLTALTPLGDIAGPFMAYSNTFYNAVPAVILSSTPADAVNSLTGVGTAWGDKVPVFLITVCPSTRLGGSFPGLTHRRTFAPFTKWSETVTAMDDIPRLVGQAWREAMSGCHGPVHLDIAEAVLGEVKEMGAEELEELVARGLGSLEIVTIDGDPELIRAGLRALLSSERPLLISGGGVTHAEAWDEMDRLVRALELPASTSISGEGGIRGDNPFYIGGPSFLGGEAFHRAVKRADCVMVVGAALGGFEGFGSPPFWNPDVRIIQVDIDPINICLNTPVEISILGDAKAVLVRMLEMVEEGEVKPNPAHRPWVEHLLAKKRGWRARVESLADAEWPVIQPAYLAKTIAELFEPDIFIAVDGGNTALWSAMFCMNHTPKSGVAPAGMGTLGCGIPAAIGIKAAAPERPLVLIQGDGAFLYNVQELATARRLGMDFVVVIFNDRCWNMIKGAQDMMFGGRHAASIIEGSDYAAIARGFGCYGRRVERAEDIEPAWREARASGLPAILDVLIDPDAIPETLISFAMGGEFEGVSLNPLRAIGKPNVKFDRRLLSVAKYAVNIFLDRDLK
ncbi:MAG: thiamine pyrophosphate-binding protein [Actinomycetota bacterium]